jgi:HTH-type transcriptional regulator / antitoxin HipB
MDTITNPFVLGRLIRDERKRQGLTQMMLAGLAGVGPRLIIEIEKGKESAEIGKVLHVMATLGIDLVAKPRETSRAPEPGRGRG